MKKIELPVDSFKEIIVETIEKNPVTIIVADTGAGKSTRVPQFLLQATNYEVVVTQPRRVAAKRVAQRVAGEMQIKFGGLVGFRTAVERNDSVETRCLFATDGLQLVRELTSAKQTIGNGVVLLIDEVHEWSTNIETLVAWVKKAISEGNNTKVVLMSATMDYEKLSAYFNDAPVIKIPGRMFPVAGSPATGVAQVRASQMTNEVKRLVAAGRNTLVFLPGKGEIAELQRELQQAQLQAVILPLHGELDSAEQDRVFDLYDMPKVILSTNVAQTSVTIPDIDAVVDSGLERRIELRNGVETLMLANVSQADCLQRAGRAGRVREGEYVLCNDTAYSNFAKYPTAEILRSRLDQMVLRLASAGLDATTLPFYHQPDSSVLREAKETLIAIEALDASGKITKLGYEINKFPTEVTAARMIIEAIERKCLGPVMTIAAILGTQSDTLRRRKRDDDPADFKSWAALIDPDKKYQSDLLVELELFWKAKDLSQYELAKNGIMPKAYGQASEIRGQLREALAGLGYQIGRYDQNANDEVAILKSVAAGMVGHLYRHTGGGEYKNGGYRTLAKESILNRLDKKPDWIVGKPMNISFKNRRGYMQTIELVSACTAVQPEWMAEIAPHLVTKKVERLYWHSVQKMVVEDHVTVFNKNEIAREQKPALWGDEAFKIFVSSMMDFSSGNDVVNQLYHANTEILSQYNKYFMRSGRAIPKKGSEIIREKYNTVLMKHQPLSFSQLENLLQKEVSRDDLLITLSELISSEEIASIEANNPLVIEIEGKEFSVIYQNDYSAVFYPMIEVTEDFIREAKMGAVMLPGGREVKLKYSGDYYPRTLGEHRAQIAEAQKQERERQERDLVNNFDNQTHNSLIVPEEAAFRDLQSWSRFKTPAGELLERRFNELRVQMLEGLTLENLSERVETLKGKAEEIKVQLQLEYEKAQALITGTEEVLENVLIDLDATLVADKIDQARLFISMANDNLKGGNFTQVQDCCTKVKIIADNITSIAENRKQERDQLIKHKNIPEYLLEVFSGDLQTTLQFMNNVAKIDTWRLDPHEITCGRARVTSNIEAAWSAMGEESDFFCGADPNDVKYYVYQYHFGDGLQEPEEEEGFSSTSNDNSDFAEKLRNALKK